MDLQRAIINTHANVAIVRDDEAFDIDDNLIVLDEDLITAEIQRLQAEYDSKQYARDRAAEYAALNQFEMQFDDQQNNTTTSIKSSTEHLTLNADGAGKEIKFQANGVEVARIDANGWVGAGGPSLGTDAIIRTNGQTISENITIPSTTNGMSIGDITVADGYTVTVNGRWVVI